MEPGRASAALLVAHCQPPATGQDTHAQRNLLTTAPASHRCPIFQHWLSPCPRSSDPPAPQPPPPSSVKHLGVKVPQRPVGTCQRSASTQSRCSPGSVAAVEEGELPAKAVAPSGDSSPRGTARQEQKGSSWALDAAGRSHGICLWLTQRHCPTQCGLFTPRHPSSMAQGAVLGSGAAPGAPTPGQAPSPLHQLGWFSVRGSRGWAGTQHPPGDTLQGSKEQLRGGGLPHTSQESHGGEESVLFLRANIKENPSKPPLGFSRW